MADQFAGSEGIYPTGSFYKDLADRLAALEAAVGPGGGGGGGVPDFSITRFKLADGAVTTAKLGDGAAAEAKIAPEMVDKIYQREPFTLLPRGVVVDLGTSPTRHVEIGGGANTTIDSFGTTAPIGSRYIVRSVSGGNLWISIFGASLDTYPRTTIRQLPQMSNGTILLPQNHEFEIARIGNNGSWVITDWRTPIGSVGYNQPVTSALTDPSRAASMDAVRAAIQGFTAGYEPDIFDRTASRSVNTSYQNTGYRPLFIYLQFLGASSTNAFQISKDGTTWRTIGNTTGAQLNVCGVVPVGWYCRVFRSVGTATTINFWIETDTGNA